MESEVKLPEGYEIIEDEPKEAVEPLPEGYEIVEEPKEEELFKDVIGEQLPQEQDDEAFSAELERRGELGTAEALRGLFSGASLGLTEHIPGLKTGKNAAAETGEVVGSFVPLTQFLKGSEKLYKLAQKSPYFKKTLGALGNLTGAFLGGAAYETSKEIIKGELPDTNTVLEHGTEWALLDGALRAAGATGKFGVELLKKARKTKKPEWKLVNEVYNGLKEQGIDVGKDSRVEAKAFSILEDIGKETPKARTTRKEVKPQKIESAQKAVDELSEPILPEAQKESLNVNRIVEDVERKAIDERIASVGKQTVDDAALGKQIQEGVTEAKDAAKSQYKPLYNEVEGKARNIVAKPETTARAAGNLIKAMEELKTQTPGYSGVIKTLENVLEDVGYHVQRNKAGAIEHIIQKGEPTLDKLIELGRRLNEVVEYDVLDRTVKAKINPIVKAVKEDIRQSLKAVDEDLLASWELAEESFGVNAKKFGRDFIRKIRGNQALEAIPKSIESATALNDLRAVLPGSQMRDV